MLQCCNAAMAMHHSLFTSDRRACKIVKGLDWFDYLESCETSYCKTCRKTLFRCQSGRKEQRKKNWHLDSCCCEILCLRCCSISFFLSFSLSCIRSYYTVIDPVASEKPLLYRKKATKQQPHGAWPIQSTTIFSKRNSVAEKQPKETLDQQRTKTSLEQKQYNEDVKETIIELVLMDTPDCCMSASICRKRFCRSDYHRRGHSTEISQWTCQGNW